MLKTVSVKKQTYHHTRTETKIKSIPLILL